LKLALKTHEAKMVDVRAEIARTKYKLAQVIRDAGQSKNLMRRTTKPLTRDLSHTFIDKVTHWEDQKSPYTDRLIKGK
jgi:hypothetical protein